jgi:hypothetical protein
MRIQRLGLGIAGLLFAAAPTAALDHNGIPDAYLYRVLIDSDSDDTTGCDVAAHDDNFTGPVKGIEYIVRALVLRFPLHADVDHIRVSRCDSGTDFFESELVDDGAWPVSLETGDGGADVIEFYVPRGKIGNPDGITLGFHATRTAILNDVLLTSNGTSSGDDIIFDLGASGVPLLTPGGVFVCVAVLVGLAAWNLRRRRPQVAAAVLAVGIATAAATGWAVTIMLDGMLGDWASVPQIAQDILDDSTADDPAEDIVAAYVTADAQNVYFRMDQVNLCPVQCGNGVLESGEQCESPSDCNAADEARGSGGAASGCECNSCVCSRECDPT